jgi:replicative DNA helicase
LLDSDGSYANKGYEITQKREDLAHQIKYLADSLGFRTHIKAKRATIKDRGFECTVWRVTIHGDMTCVPMKVERKKPAERIINKDWRVTGIKIEPAGVDDFFGFVIDGDGLFLLEDMTVTHNTILVEMIAEWWAKRKLKVVFVHYELNRALMMDRRTARHTSIEVRTLKSGMMTQEQRALVNAIRPKLLAWNGEITYLHTPGWTVDQTVAELRRQHAEGRCDVVVIDYLEKIAPSKRQMDIFGSNVWQREGDNVEQFKNFAEITEVPVVMVAQMNKAGKDETYKRMSRNDMGGSADKSNKANLVVLVKRDRDEDTGEYSNIMHVEIDKNTMGATGAFDQIMEPKFFRLTDIYREPLNK